MRMAVRVAQVERCHSHSENGGDIRLDLAWDQLWLDSAWAVRSLMARVTR
jgi:hypothetical protein